jgi:hypothetical protein
MFGRFSIMHTLWAILMVAAGLFFLLGATRRSDFVPYRLLVARSRMLWGDHVHRFHQVVGIVLLVLGLLWAFGVIWR